MENNSSISLRVRYQETDQMGVVHHANYISWFEVGRTQWLRQMGTDYREVEKKGLLLPVIGVSCQYKHPAFYDDVVEIQAKLCTYSGVKLSFEYEVTRKSEPLVKGITEHCWTRPDFKPVSLKRVWPEMHSFMENIVKTSS